MRNQNIAIKSQENYEILKENKLYISSQSRLEKIVRKQTDGDKMTGSEAGEEGEMDGEEIQVGGLKPPKPKFLAASLPMGTIDLRNTGLSPQTKISH